MAISKSKNEDRELKVQTDDTLFKSVGGILFDIGENDKQELQSGLKLSKNGHTVLIPQPTDDPDDPLNWSSWKKHSILAIISIAGFLADFQSGAGIPCIILQGQEWHQSPVKVNRTNNINVLMVGLGGIFFIPLISSWGRAPVLFWTSLFGTGFTLGCCITTDFTTFYGLRVLMGFFLTALQTIGLSFIQDMFFFHEHARKIGIWSAFYLASPYLGPLFGNFIISGTGAWRPVFWVVFALGCLNVILIVAFIDEPWYNRKVSLRQQPARGNRLMRVLGIWQIKNHTDNFLTIQASCTRLVQVLFKPIMIPVMIYYMFILMWAVGINGTTSILFSKPTAAGGYGYGPKALGYLYFTPIVAVCLGEAFGHFFNDFLANKYIRKHDGMFKPEVRLWANYIAACLMVPGIVIIGQALAKHLSVGAVVMGWGMYAFGYMVASVAVIAYVLDSYPGGSGEISCLINFARVIGGFTVAYFQEAWGEKSGFALSFGLQGMVMAIGTGLLMMVHIFGARLRASHGSLETNA